MAEPEFDATGVRIARWLRSLTRAGQVLIRDGRLVLLTSYGREIDSAPVEQVRVSGSWYRAPDRAVASLNGTRYLLRIGHRERLLQALNTARARASKATGTGSTRDVAPR